MKFSPRLYLLIAAALTLPASQLVFQGCATIAYGPAQKIDVDTKPHGATLLVDGKTVGVTPKVLIVSRWQNPRLRLELAGFQPYELRLEKTVNDAATTGNMFIGFAPIVIDAVTGSIFTLDVPKDRRKELMTRPWDTKTFDSAALYIGVELKPDPKARKIGQMERKRL